MLPFAITACAANPIPIQGPSADVARLAGAWHGAYSSVDTDRHGDIHFTLEPGTDSATGYVVMVPHTGHGAMSIREEPYELSHPERFEAQGLLIQFVSVGGNRVSGALEPYRDPDCGCQVTTTFIGEMGGDVIEGTYRTVHANGRVVAGNWRVQREPQNEGSVN